MSTQFFYGEPGGAVHGPLEWDAIRAGMHAGRTSKDLVVSQTGSEPWVSARDVENAGFAAFSRTVSSNVSSPGLPQPEVKPPPAKVMVDQANPNSVAGFLEMFGYINITLAGVCIVAVLVMLGDGKPVFQLVAGAVSCLSVGVLFLAAGELLSRLKEISVALHIRK